MIQLYHGSTVNINNIDLAKSRPNKDFGRLKEHVTTACLIQILIEERGCSLEEAIDRVYTSPIYEKLSDPNTGLFFQSPRYVYSYL